MQASSSLDTKYRFKYSIWNARFRAANLLSEIRMLNDHALADCAGAILIEKAERRLDALLAEHGVSDPKELPPATAFEIFQRAVIETAAATFPAANVEMLKHGCRSFGHSAFLTAMERMRVSCKSPGDAFEMTRGVHAAVVLAGYGLPVAPSTWTRCASSRHPAKTLIRCSSCSPAIRACMSATAAAKRRFICS